MKKYNIYVAILLSISALLVLDFIYVASVTVFYKRSVKVIQRGEDMKLNVFLGILCYVIMIIGLIFIIITQLSRYGSLRSLSHINKLKYALRFGGVVGFVIYGVFNTTNLAIFKRYSVPLAVIDIIWGSLLYTIATYVYLVMS
jgi:uncharacterized membrane protein